MGRPACKEITARFPQCLQHVRRDAQGSEPRNDLGIPQLGHVLCLQHLNE